MKSQRHESCRSHVHINILSCALLLQLHTLISSAARTTASGPTIISHATPKPLRPSRQLERQLAPFKPAPHLLTVTHVGRGKWRILKEVDSQAVSTATAQPSEKTTAPSSSIGTAFFGDSSPSRAEQRILLTVKRAWGGSFFGADTWKALSRSWYGVKVDGRGRVIGLTLPAGGITGPLPSALAMLTSLTSIDLQGNAMTGSIPRGLFKSLPLSEVYLSGNQLSGVFPWDELAGKSLSMLELYGNQFTGSIPSAAFAGMKQLQSLSLGGNSFSGPLPSQLPSPLLSQIDISNNKFTGGIPTSWGSIPSLCIIDLSGNQLTGSIPSGFANLPYLVNLNLGSNRLSGRLPVNFTSGPSLRTLILSNNFFTGPLPRFPNLAEGCPESDTLNCYYLTATLDFSSNYLEGPAQLAAPIPGGQTSPGADKICPQTDGPGSFLVDDNCLSPANGCLAENQRSAAACQQFCGAGSRAGQCSKRGMCVPSFASGSATGEAAAQALPVFSCSCARGFKATGGNNWQCAKST